MINPRERNVIRKRVHTRIREKMSGTAHRPRLNVYRSLNHIYTQLIDDLNGVTLASASSMHVKGDDKVYGGNVHGSQARREADRRASAGEGHQEGGLRSRRVSISRPREGPGRGSPRSRIGFLGFSWLPRRRPGMQDKGSLWQ